MILSGKHTHLPTKLWKRTRRKVFLFLSNQIQLFGALISLIAIFHVSFQNYSPKKNSNEHKYFIRNGNGKRFSEHIEVNNRKASINNQFSLLRSEKTEMNLSDTFQSLFSRTNILEERKSRQIGPMFEHVSVRSNPDAKLCRIHGGCLTSNNFLLLDTYLRKYEPIIKACKNVTILYKTNQDVLLSRKFYNIDLYGVEPARWHMPHFLTDILPYMYAYEVFKNLTESAETSYSCAHQDGISQCNPPKLHLSPALMVDNRAQSFPVMSWVPQLMLLLPGSPLPLFPKQLFQSNEVSCFQTVTIYNEDNFIRKERKWYGDQNPLFYKHGIFRGSGRVGVPKVISSWEDTHKLPRRYTTFRKCEKRVLVINRGGPDKYGDVTIARDLVNIKEIKDAVEKYSEQYPSFHIVFEEVLFENKTFEDQVMFMQNTDIVLGVHGAGLSNLLFARMDVPVIEILPFTYYAGPFDKLAKALFQPYKQLYGLPDSKTYLKCLKYRSVRSRNESLYLFGKSMWDEAVRRYERSGDLRFMQTNAFREEHLAPLKVCARMQRIRVNAAESAQSVVSAAKYVCGGEPYFE